MPAIPTQTMETIYNGWGAVNQDKIGISKPKEKSTSNFGIITKGKIVETKIQQVILEIGEKALAFDTSGDFDQQGDKFDNETDQLLTAYRNSIEEMDAEEANSELFFLFQTISNSMFLTLGSPVITILFGICAQLNEKVGKEIGYDYPEVV